MCKNIKLFRTIYIMNFYKELLDLVEKKQLDEALKIYTQLLDLAKAGDAQAQSQMGYIYNQGIYVDEEKEQSLSWYLMAAKGGDINSQYNLGCIYRDGDGIEVNINHSVNWFTKAADQGDINAQFSLGWLFEMNVAIVDFNKSAYWYQRAADQGDKEAKDNLERLALDFEEYEVENIYRVNGMWIEDLASAAYEICAPVIDDFEGDILLFLLKNWPNEYADAEQLDRKENGEDDVEYEANPSLSQFTDCVKPEDSQKLLRDLQKFVDCIPAIS
jgi:TPR repeat protein